MADDDKMLRELAELLTLDEGTPHPSHIRAVRLAAEDLSSRLRDPRHSVEPRMDTARVQSSRRRIWLAAAMLVVGVAAGLLAAPILDRVAPAIGELRDGGTVEYAGPLTQPGGEDVGRLQVTRRGIGRTIELRTGTLPILPTGEYYEVWFVSAADAPERPDRISAGTFHPNPQGVSESTFTAAVDPGVYGVVEVTAEPADGNPAATGPVVLRTTING